MNICFALLLLVLCVLFNVQRNSGHYCGNLKLNSTHIAHNVTKLPAVTTETNSTVAPLGHQNAPSNSTATFGDIVKRVIRQASNSTRKQKPKSSRRPKPKGTRKPKPKSTVSPKPKTTSSPKSTVSPKPETTLSPKLLVTIASKAKRAAPFWLYATGSPKPSIAPRNIFFSLFGKRTTAGPSTLATVIPVTAPVSDSSVAVLFPQ